MIERNEREPPVNVDEGNGKSSTKKKYRKSQVSKIKSENGRQKSIVAKSSIICLFKSFLDFLFSSSSSGVPNGKPSFIDSMKIN